MSNIIKPKVNLEDINFSQNWNNKLSCECFSTFRMHNKNKYYVGAIRNIKLKTKLMKQARIKTLHTLKLSEVTEGMALIDTAMTKAEFQVLINTMHKKIVANFETQLWDFMILKTIKENE